MAFPLFQFLSKPNYDINTNAAAANLVNAEHNWANERQNKAELEQRKVNEANQYNLQAAGEERLAKGEQFAEKKTKAALLDDYTTRLSAGDYAGAAAMAPQLKMLGVEPVLRAQNEAPAKQYSEAGPTEDKYKPQAIPPLLMKQMGGAMPQEPSVPSSETPQPEGEVYDFIDTTTGEKLGTVDTAQFKAQAKEKAQRIGEGFKALPLPSGFPADQITEPAATEGEQKFAIGNAMDLINNAMRHPHGRGGGGAAGVPGPKEAHALQTEIRTTMQAAATDQKVADSNKTLNNISTGLADLEAGKATSVGERASIAQLIKSSFPGAISDRERTYITEANGIQGRINNALGYWVNNGHMDPQLIADVRRLQEIAQTITRDRVDSAAATVAESWGRTHPELSPDVRERYIQEGISLHSPQAAERRRKILPEGTGGKPKRPAVLGP